MSPSTYSVIYSEKICPLFGQILITCLKCSRASFSPSCYSEKVRWDEVARKRAQTCISCTNGDRKMKIKIKRNFDVRYSFMKLFPRNLQILAPLDQKDSNLYIMYKILKSGTITTLI